MPRRPRVVMPGVPLHLIQRGNNRQACFYAEDDYLFYLDCLREYANQTECAIHAYVLMTNHVHLLVSPVSRHGVGGLMKRLGQRYVQYINRTYKRSGTLWEGRFRSCLVQEESYLLACQRYIEMNPVRANMVGHPAEYCWSSYWVSAQSGQSDVVQHHPLYLALGDSPVDRQINYRELFRMGLEPDMVDKIRSATNGNYVLGDSVFAQQIEQSLGRRVQPGRGGRPRKNVAR